MKNAAIAFALVGAALGISGCAKREDDASNAQTFALRGYIESVEAEGQRLMIDHEEIPDYMPAMIMQFKVADWSEARELAPGDQIAFDYHVASKRSWIDNIEKTGLRRDPNARHLGSDDARSSGWLPLQPNDNLPNYAFTDEAGKAVSLGDYRGSVVAITFIFTRCPVPEYCPAMMRNFGDVDALLKNEPPAGAPWRLVTISFDPEHDTPEAMKRYGDAFNYDPQHWDLLTSESLEPIEALAQNVGLKFGKSGDSILHNLRTVVLDPQGRITRIFTDETWSPAELADEMREAGKTRP